MPSFNLFTRSLGDHAQQGFTFIELMVTASISACLLTLAVPSFSSLLSNNRVLTKTNELHTALYRARAHAITHSKTVIVCAAQDTQMQQCSERRQRDANWQYGWIIFADEDRDNELSESDTVLSIAQHDNSTAIVFNQNGRLRFFADGSARSAGFYLCEPKSDAEGYLRLLYTGRARTSDKLGSSRRQKCLNSKRS